MMGQAIFSSRRSKFFLLMAALALLCWGRLLFLKGIWWDDWAWVWYYFGSGGLSEFLAPFKSLRHPLDGILMFFNFRLLDIIPGQATSVWSIFKFVIFVLNPLLLYFILKGLTDGRSILPETAAITYLVSPIVNNLCTVEFGRRIYMFLFLLSILFSIRSVSENGIKMPYYLSALFFSVLSIFGIESFIFFELARPAIIFYLFNKKRGGTLLKNAQQAVFYWAPFFIVGSLILIYNIGFTHPRQGLYAHAYDFSNLSLGRYIIFISEKYIVSIRALFTNNLVIFAHHRVSVLILGTAFLSALVTIFVLGRINGLETGSGKKIGVPKGAVAWVITGALLVILGLFPYMVVRDAIVFGIFTRHALLASLGFSVFLPSCLLWLHYRGIIKKTLCYILFGVIIFSGVFNCNSVVKAYSDDWQQQKSFWSQFVKKVPEIRDSIYLIVDMPRNEKLFFGYWHGSFEFSAPLNLIYATSRDKTEVNRHFAESLENALNPAVGWSYVNNKNKETCYYESFRGTDKFCAKNPMVASYSNGKVYINNEIVKAGMRPDIRDVITNSSPEQIINKRRGLPHPLRSIMGLE